MAYETGTASDWLDLFARFRTFITGGQLAQEGQAWEELEYRAAGHPLNHANGPMLFLKGKGLGGTDEIHVNVACESDSNSDSANWIIQGADGYRQSSPWAEQLNASTNKILATRYEGQMDYWLIANGRRFIVVVRCVTVYNACYAGLFIPYATPSEFPYPMFLGGSGSSGNYRTATSSQSNFWDPDWAQTAQLRRVDSTWLALRNFPNVNSHNSAGTGHKSFAHIWPYAQGFGLSRTARPYDNLDGSKTLFPCALVSEEAESRVFGELDGVFYVPSLGVNSEDIVTVDGEDYLIVQNVYRTTEREFAAIRLA